MVDIAVVIVTWHVRELILDALRSLLDDLDNSGLAVEVYVVDNASTDGTAAAVADTFPQVTLIASDENLGFVKANNLAMRRMGFEGDVADDDLPRAVYLLNPDTITQPGATRALYDALMTQPNVGLVGAQLAYEDGRFQHGAFAFPGLRQLWVEFFPTPGRLIESSFNGRYPRSTYDAGEPFDVDFTLGATMMLRREVIQQTGMFDEGFFMYCEEVDWAWRIKKAGWRVLCVPEARVTHLEGQSTRQAKASSIIHLWKSRMRMFRKHYPSWKFFVARWMVVRGMNRKIRQVKADASLSDEDRKALIGAYSTVLIEANRV